MYSPVIGWIVLVVCTAPLWNLFRIALMVASSPPASLDAEECKSSAWFLVLLAAIGAAIGLVESGFTFGIKDSLPLDVLLWLSTFGYAAYIGVCLFNAARFLRQSRRYHRQTASCPQ